MRALLERAERVTAATGSRPATSRATATGTWRGGPVPSASAIAAAKSLKRIGASSATWKVEPAGADSGRVAQRPRDVLDVHDVPPVLAAPDDREAARLADPLHQLAGEPAAGTVDVRGPHDDVRQARLAHQPLALLLRAPVGRLDRQHGVLVEQRAVRVARHDGRGEDDLRRAGGRARLQAAVWCRPRSPLRSARGRAASRSRPRGAARTRGARRRRAAASAAGSPARSACASSQPGGAEPGRRTSAVTACPCARSSRQANPPRKPLAPVTKTCRRARPGRSIIGNPASAIGGETLLSRLRRATRRTRGAFASR